MGGLIVVSRRSVPDMRMTGLKRAAQLAGEAFGHEDALMATESTDWHATRWLWWTAALLAAAGLAVLHFN